MDFKNISVSLKNSILASNEVFITSHNRLDIDAIASALALYNIVESFGKKAYIVCDDVESAMEPGVKKIISEVCLFVNFCTSESVVVQENDLLITTDVNQIPRICLRNKLLDFKNIIVYDHHAKNQFTINTPNLFIDEKISSSCEIVTRILKNMQIELKEKSLYSYLYAGMILDTRHFTKPITSFSMHTAAYLIEKGADVNQANSLLIQDFEADRRMQRLVGFANFKILKTVLAMDKDNPNSVYFREDIARAADYLLNFNAETSFVLGFTDYNKVSISARSKGTLDVGDILKNYGGGGNTYSAGADIFTSDIKNVYDDLDRRTSIEPIRSLKIYK